MVSCWRPVTGTGSFPCAGVTGSSLAGVVHNEIQLALPPSGCIIVTNSRESCIWQACAGHCWNSCAFLLPESILARESWDADPSLPLCTNAARRLHAYLCEHVTQHMPLDDMARAAGMSKFHLVRAFHRQYGTPPRAYQMRLRFALALSFLARGMALSRVAYEAGFADQSHLTRRFHEYLGMTPGEYARQTSFSHIARPASHA